MKNYIKKPVIIQAIQVTDENFIEIHEISKSNNCIEQLVSDDGLLEGVSISTLEGNMRANLGDWIIKGIKGEYYPCKPDIFNETYNELPNE